MGRRRQATGNLPVEVSTLVGRRAETLDVRRMLDTSRLVTVTGVGGVGKSRLAVRVASDMPRRFPGGVWLAELAGLHDPAVLPHLVADALGIRDEGSPDEIEVLARFLTGRQALLVLDNCEYLLEACAELVTILLRGSPDLRVLVTSRESLRVSGEHLYPLPALAHPEVGNGPPGSAAQVLARYPAVALFAERAAAACRGFEVTDDNVALVAGVCAALDGIPLSIELAAVQLYTLSLEQLADLLASRRTLPAAGMRAGAARHRSQFAAVAWSYDLCTDAERRLWNRLSVFAGDFDLAAVADVAAGDDLPAEEVLAVVVGLVDKSILTFADHATGRRYRLLETFRQYGAERLAAAGERDDVAVRHRDHFLRLAERADADWFGPRQLEWLDRLHREYPNLRAALEYSLATPGHAAVGLHLATVLWMHWNCAGFVSEGRYWLDKGLALNREPGPVRTAALRVNGVSAILQGDAAGGRAMFDEALAWAERTGDERARAYGLKQAGVGALMKGADGSAAALLSEAIDRFAALGLDDAKAAMTGAELAIALARQGDFDRATTLSQDVVEASEKHGDLWVRGYGCFALAYIAAARGDTEGTVKLARDCLRTERRLGNRSVIAQLVELIAGATAPSGGAERAAVLYGVAQALWGGTGQPLFGHRGIDERQGGHRERIRHTLGAAAWAAACRRGADLTLDEAVGLALDEHPPATPATSAGSPDGARDILSPREREVAGLVGKGLSNKQIAASLVIAQRTAESHVEHILAKLGFSSRTQIAARYAPEGGIRDEPAPPAS